MWKWPSHFWGNNLSWPFISRDKWKDPQVLSRPSIPLLQHPQRLKGRQWPQAEIPLRLILHVRWVTSQHHIIGWPLNTEWEFRVLAFSGTMPFLRHGTHYKGCFLCLIPSLCSGKMVMPSNKKGRILSKFSHEEVPGLWAPVGKNTDKLPRNTCGLDGPVETFTDSTHSAAVNDIHVLWYHSPTSSLLRARLPWSLWETEVCQLPLPINTPWLQLTVIFLWLLISLTLTRVFVRIQDFHFWIISAVHYILFHTADVICWQCCMLLQGWKHHIVFVFILWLLRWVLLALGCC